MPFRRNRTVVAGVVRSFHSVHRELSRVTIGCCGAEQRLGYNGDPATSQSGPVPFRRGGVFEGHLDHRSGGDEIIEGGLMSVPTSSEMLQDLSSGNRVRDHGRSAIKVEVSASFQVDDEAWISEKVRQPVGRS